MILWKWCKCYPERKCTTLPLFGSQRKNFNLGWMLLFFVENDPCINTLHTFTKRDFNFNQLWAKNMWKTIEILSAWGRKTIKLLQKVIAILKVNFFVTLLHEKKKLELVWNISILNFLNLNSILLDCKVKRMIEIPQYTLMNSNLT